MLKGRCVFVNGNGRGMNYVRIEVVKLFGSVRRLWGDWLERYSSLEPGVGGVSLSGARMSLSVAAKGVLFAVLAFFMALASLGTPVLISGIESTSGLAFDARPLGMALLCASGMYTPFVWAGVLFASMFLGSSAVLYFLCACFALAMRLAFALWLAPSGSGKDRRRVKGAENPAKLRAAYRTSRVHTVRFFEEPLLLRVGLALGCASLIAVYRIISGGFLWFDIIGGLCELCTLPLFTFIFAGALDADKRFTAAYEAGIYGMMFAVVVSLRAYMPFGFSLSSVAAAVITLFTAKTGGILRGGIIFYADLLREISIDCNMDFMCLSSYCGTASTGEVRTMLDLRESVKGRHLVVVEDIVDTGLTLDYLQNHLKDRGAASIEICCLLDKPANRKVDVTPKYVGFTIENEFVIGYGLDYNELYRNLPYIGVFKQR